MRSLSAAISILLAAACASCAGSQTGSGFYTRRVTVDPVTLHFGAPPPVAARTNLLAAGRDEEEDYGYGYEFSDDPLFDSNTIPAPGLLPTGCHEWSHCGVEARIRSAQEGFASCLGADTTRSFDVRAVVMQDGTVAKIGVVPNEPSAKEGERCVAMAFRHVRFTAELTEITTVLALRLELTRRSP